nr:DUF1120 domain-containing protein [uncultured Cupriavidus sp.]
MMALPAIPADTANIVIKGTIRPTACDLSLSKSGLVDYGSIRALTLSDSTINVLPGIPITLSIRCDQPTRFAVRLSDGRPGTALEETNTEGTNQNFGLGTAGNRNIGSAKVFRKGGSRGDGNTTGHIYQFMSTQYDWYATTEEYGINHLAFMAWAIPGARTPYAYSTMTQNLEVQARLPRKSDLPDFKDGLTLDGFIIMTLYYL